MMMVQHLIRRRFAIVGDNRRSHFLRTFFLLTAILVSADAAHAQRVISLASFVPDDVVFYAEFDKLDRLESEVSGADAWDLVRGFLGESSGGDWRELLGERLSINTEETIRTLWRTRFAVAVGNWNALNQAVIIVERPDGLTTPNTIRLFAGDDVIRQWRKGTVPLVESRNGLIVAVGDRIVAVSPVASTGSLMDGIVNQLSGRRFSALSRHGPFRIQIRGLPRHRNALVYWKTPAPEAAESDASGAALGTESAAPSNETAIAQPRVETHVGADFPPLFRSGVLALSLSRGVVEVVARDAAPPPDQFVYTPRVRAAPIERLPQSTLAAWATTIDPQTLWSNLEDNPPQRIGVRIFEHVKARVDTDQLRENVLDRLGPRIITVLGCDFTSDQRRPFAGVLIECVEPQPVADALAKLIVTHSKRGPGGDPVLRSTEHLGTIVYELPFADRRQDAPDSLAQLLVSDLRPSFSSMDGWFVVSTSPAHIEQILDAARGLATSVGDVVDLASQRRRLERSISSVVIQPAFAVSTLRFWDQLFDRPAAIASDDYFGQALGFDLDSNGSAGCVVVRDVDSNGSSASLIRKGDRIVAADGAALDLERAADHLARLIRQRSNPNQVTLRVLRDETFLDATVDLDVKQDQWTTAAEIEGLFELLAPIESVASRLNLAVYASINPPRSARSAELMLQLSPGSTGPPKSADAGQASAGADGAPENVEPDAP